MSSFFIFLYLVSFIAMIVFIVQARRKRRGAGKKAWIALGASIVFIALGGSTMTAAERKVAEARNQAEAQQVAARQAQAAKVAAAQKLQDAQNAKRDEANRLIQEAEGRKQEAIRKANTSIEPAAMIVACQRQARERLKLPDTARFPGFMEGMDNQPSVGPVGAVWSSWVESENAFGGTVRSKFKCQYVKKDNTLYLDFADN